MTRDIRRLSERKRRGEELAEEEIRWLVDAYTAGEIDDAPMAAWLMAVCCTGMSDDETWHLTRAMAHSGEMLNLLEIGPHTVDKHSTGGVGDKITLVAAPLAAACGARVPKMSGRGLGHTGGTIDKLEAIPGLRTDLSPGDVPGQTRDIGLVLGAQTEALAPADAKIYALRDTTGTVDSRPLIAASIMSKKLAAGARAIVLETTVGSGAFMRNEQEARDLTALMMQLGKRAGRKVGAVLTGMDTPLGRAVGNAVEVEEAVRTLRGDGPEDVAQLSVAVAAQMVVLAGIASDTETAEQAVLRAVDSGEGFEKLVEMIEAQGGDSSVIDEKMLGHQPEKTGYLRAESSGRVTRIEARGVGYASLEAGAGRRRKGDRIDPAAGVRIMLPEGSFVERGEAIIEVMASSAKRLEKALAELERAVAVSEQEADSRPPIIEILTAEAGQ